MYRKKYVRVESLALTRAIELQKETGFGRMYLSSSDMLDEYGWAQEMHESNRGDEHALSLAALGLESEVDKIQATEGCHNSYIFLERHYQFLFNDPDTNKTVLRVGMIISKADRESDWGIQVENVIRGQDGVFFPTTGEVLHRDYRESAPH